jgi:putative phosphoesterase
MKIGILSDTHIPVLSPVLPARIAGVFEGLDIILHAGDICELYMLEQFQETYTLTFAVSGEGDSEEVRRYLEERQVVRFGERRIGLVHGHQFELGQKGTMSWLHQLFGGKSDPETLPDFLLAQFAEDNVDAIVFGHTHQPHIKMHQGVLLFNPGAALAGPGRRPSVGILDVRERSITGKIVYL